MATSLRLFSTKEQTTRKKRSLPKAPKKPRASATLGQMESYLRRRADWQKRVNGIIAERNKKIQLYKKIQSIK
ncbi:MAG: hypothetical protein LBB41_06605 [Prevotellaceae bacterium]|jgi:hypothetical protein|nr:hypothetical protein [Prevotellaceae bacterium]